MTMGYLILLKLSMSINHSSNSLATPVTFLNNKKKKKKAVCEEDVNQGLMKLS